MKRLLMAKTVKAREHHGADSLDLTLPTDLVREHDITPGDIFEVTLDHEDEGNPTICYELVHRTDE